MGYFLPWKDALVGELEEAGADEVVCFRARTPLGLLTAIPRVRRTLRRWGADFLHCHLPLSGVVGRLAARGLDLPVVYTEHNVQERYRRPTRWANRLTWSLQDQVLAVSSEVERSIRRNRLRGAPVRVIRNGIPVESFASDREARARRRKSLGIASDAFVVGQVAVFRTQKRLDLWLQAANRLHRQEPDLRFLLVGDGPLRLEVEKQVRTLSLADVVLLPGLQEDVRPFLAAMDLFLVTSDFEGLPLAVLEAMAAGLPVVSTRAGGTPEAVVPEGTGLLLDRGDVKGLTDAVLRIRSDPELRRRMGEAGRRRVEEEFSTRRMVEELLEVYREVAG